MPCGCAWGPPWYERKKSPAGSAPAGPHYPSLFRAEEAVDGDGRARKHCPRAPPPAGPSYPSLFRLEEELEAEARLQRRLERAVLEEARILLDTLADDQIRQVQRAAVET